MLVVAVESTTLAAVGYEDPQELLQLEFVAGQSIITSACCCGACSAAVRAVKGQLFQSRHSRASRIVWCLPFLQTRWMGEPQPGTAARSIYGTHLATLPAGSRITDYISLGVIAKFFPPEKIREIWNKPNGPVSASAIFQHT